MARDLALGNGHSLVMLDRKGQVCEFYYPYVGLESHIMMVPFVKTNF